MCVRPEGGDGAACSGRSGPRTRTEGRWAVRVAGCAVEELGVPVGRCVAVVRFVSVACPPALRFVPVAP
ncbi:hypothetical protein SCALM49S_03889 [Streptomyces californicus]